MNCWFCYEGLLCTKSNLADRYLRAFEWVSTPHTQHKAVFVIVRIEIFANIIFLKLVLVLPVITLCSFSAAWCILRSQEADEGCQPVEGFNHWWTLRHSVPQRNESSDGCAPGIVEILWSFHAGNTRMENDLFQEGCCLVLVNMIISFLLVAAA